MTGRLPRTRRTGRAMTSIARAVLAVAMALAVTPFLAGCHDEGQHVIRAERLEWVASVPILEQGQQRQEGWNLPEGATLVSAELRPHQEIDFDDEGPETFYATWFVYEVTTPVVVDAATETGTKSQPVKVPEPRLSDGQVAGEPSVEYSVTDQDGQTHGVRQEIWDSMEVGATFRIAEANGDIVSATQVDPSEFKADG